MKDAEANPKLNSSPLAFAVGNCPIPQIPDHELLRRIGCGSYGEVWLARNVLGQFRAVKVVYRASFEQEKPYEREFAGIHKFEPISRAHEGHVDILHVGRNDATGYFYYVMELADDTNATDPVGAMAAGLISPVTQPNGQSLHTSAATYCPKTLKSEIKRRGPLPVEECVAIGLALTRALAHLHEQRLVHRDIKPSNIIFVDDAPKLADIGLVTGIDATRSFVGTDGYVPPEGPGTFQADLYALGKVLYEMSTGKDRHDFPELPENLRDLPDQDALIELNAVLVKAAAADLGQRYQCAKDMVADLTLLQRGESVQAKRRARRQLNFVRNVSTAAAVLAVAAAAVTFATKAILKRIRDEQAALPNSARAMVSGTTNAEANSAYELGRFFFNKLTSGGALKATEHFNRAIQLDPNFVAAYAGLADCYIWNPPVGYNEALPRIYALAERLLTLDPTRPEGHAALAQHLWWRERRLSEAEREFRRAIELNDRYATAHQYYGVLLTSLGRFNEAQGFLKRSVELQPTAVNFRLSLGFPFLPAGEWERAIAEFEKARELEPETIPAHAWLALAHEGKGDFLKACAHWAQCDLLSGRDSNKVQRAYAAARQAVAESGALGYWQARLARLSEQKQPVLLHVAMAHAHLGNKQQAVEWLERAAVETPADFGLLRLIFASAWDKMRDDPGFKKLVEKAGLQP